MFGDFITRILLMLFGYAYPAFECFKTVEKNRADIEQLRFWCQYWIVVALLTVFERIGDVFISWLPMYGEIKLAFFVYLWHPKTKGTSSIYDAFLQPYFAKHETDIERKLLEYRARAWDIIILYWKNFATEGQVKFFEFLQYLAKQSGRPTATRSADEMDPTAPQLRNLKTSFIHKQQEPQNKQSVAGKRRQPPTPPRATIDREVSNTPKADHIVQTLPAEETAAVIEMVNTEPNPVVAMAAANNHIQETPMEKTLWGGRVKLRRTHRQE